MVATFMTFSGPRGSFTCDANAAWYTIHRQNIIGGTGRVVKTRDMWIINGRVNSTSTGVTATPAQLAVEVDAKVNALQNVISDGMSVTFSLGSTMKLLSDNCMEGTHIKKFSWLPGYDGVRGSGAEGVLRRTFNLIIYGDVLATSDTSIMEWHESLTISGTGGPHVIPVTSLNGNVQAQQVRARSPIWVMQTGFARGLTDYPVPPPPLFLANPNCFFPEDGTSVTRMTPSQWGVNRNTGYGIQWRYKCWSSILVSGTPIIF